jgi:glycine/D-amino acid oxidase-like deaminating enzyme
VFDVCALANGAWISTLARTLGVRAPVVTQLIVSGECPQALLPFDPLR